MSSVKQGCPSISRADASARVMERILHHGSVEQTNVIADIMDTITPLETWNWMPGLAWVVPEKRDDKIKLKVSRDLDSIETFYRTARERYQVTDSGLPEFSIATEWFGITESFAKFRSVADGSEYAQSWALISPSDGEQGITGEIVWARFPELDPSNHTSGSERAAIFHDYIAALNNSDIDGILALMDPDCQAAVRDYAGTEDFAYIDGADAMRDYYERMFSTFRVLSVEPTQHVDRGWYICCENRWRVEVLKGEQAGNRGTLLIAELLGLRQDGRIYNRLGFGTALLR